MHLIIAAGMAGFVLYFIALMLCQDLRYEPFRLRFTLHALHALTMLASAFGVWLALRKYCGYPFNFNSDWIYIVRLLIAVATTALVIVTYREFDLAKIRRRKAEQAAERIFELYLLGDLPAEFKKPLGETRHAN